jgi:hypothetical protein
MEHMADSAVLADALKKNRLTENVDPCFGFAVQLGDKSTFVSPGLTKREYFAVMAMQGVLSNDAEGNVEWDYSIIAKHCCKAADALIEALNK